MKFDMELLMKELIHDEMIKYVLYYDTKGVPTIGVGRNLRAKPLNPSDLHASVMTGAPLSYAQVMDILKEDIATAVTEASHFKWFSELSGIRQMAIINMIFNLGLTKFMEFKRMIAALSVHNYDKASEEMLDSDWSTEVKSRASRLAQMMILDAAQKLT